MKTKVALLLTAFIIGLFCNAQVAPNGASHPCDNVLLTQTPTDKPWSCARCDVATLQKGIPNDGVIEVDFLEMIQENLITGQRTVIAREDYNNSGAGLTTNEGGLYLRSPWFVTGDQPRFMTNAVQNNCCLVIRVGEQPDFISHFWTDWCYNAPNTRLFVKASFRITGDIGFQFGLDYAPTSNGNLNDHSEAFFSGWFNSTNGDFITITYPDYDNPVSFDREHYGFYKNGLFFISKKMVEYKNGISVDLKSDATSWQSVQMTLNGDRYELDTRRLLNQATLYCFRINQEENCYMPALFMKSAINPLVHPEDVVSNGYTDGYNFLTNPLPPLSVDELSESLNVRIITSPGAEYVSIESNAAIQRIFISDVGGKIILDYTRKVPLSIPIANLSTGTYLITVETDNGSFTQKFNK